MIIVPPFVPNLKSECDTKYFKIYPNSEKNQKLIRERIKESVNYREYPEENESIFKEF